ncbi:uncharacterized protein LOC116188858 [Punica granatum]|uniref:Uncharacterized protein n=2 Tax=Punica granatum TaxID=22663 RepID=A0A218X5U3_PUNGR|nr:uncharacterized protein LOC116188858 [Punica granatum]OWM80066.1 hypothetical protein CDL15_Pgr010044 [Punica granatum]PKI70287.1 hypothetical protein CRG98_009316 [Punica granatum]
MGNFSSCLCSGSSSTQSAKLLDPHGSLLRLDVPVRVAELMLEYPGHLVSSLDRVRGTGRFIALRADDELLAGKAYITVPFNRIDCRATEDELAVIESARKGGRDLDTGSKVFRDVVVEADGKDGKKGGDGLLGGQQQQQLSCYWSHRQWNPVLEPIFEDQGVL